MKLTCLVRGEDIILVRTAVLVFTDFEARILKIGHYRTVLVAAVFAGLFIPSVVKLLNLAMISFSCHECIQEYFRSIVQNKHGKASLRDRVRMRTSSVRVHAQFDATGPGNSSTLSMKNTKTCALVGREEEQEERPPARIYVPADLSYNMEMEGAGRVAQQYYMITILLIHNQNSSTVRGKKTRKVKIQSRLCFVSNQQVYADRTYCTWYSVSHDQCISASVHQCMSA